MRKHLLWCLLALCLSCADKYDDSESVGNSGHISFIPKYEELFRKMNADISSLQTLLDAQAGLDHITNITSVTMDGNRKGFTISFSKSKPLTINVRADEEICFSPQICIEKGSDSTYYWTLNDDWLEDSNQNLISVDSNGNIPRLKIENKYWHVSSDNGQHWLKLYQAPPDSYHSIFSSITITENNWAKITLVNGTEFLVPVYSKHPFIVFNTNDSNSFLLSKITEIGYQLRHVFPTTILEVISTPDIEARVIAKNFTQGYIHIKSVAPLNINSSVTAVIHSGPRIVTASITFVEGIINVADTHVINGKEQEIQIDVTTNMEYNVSIPSDSKRWLNYSSSQSRSMHTDKLSFAAKANNTQSIRSATISLEAAGLASRKVVITQMPLDSDSETTVQIVDPNFKRYLIQKYDTNGDAEIGFAEAGLIREIDVNNQDIASLSGIESFPNLLHLECASNQLTTLNLTNCTALKFLDCSDNKLTSIKLTNCIALEYLDISSNHILRLNVDNSLHIRHLNCSSNWLGTLNLDHCSALTTLDCNSNQLSRLSLSFCLALKSLNCNRNRMKTLNLSGCPNMRFVSCRMANDNLFELLLRKGQTVEQLDISESTKIHYLD